MQEQNVLRVNMFGEFSLSYGGKTIVDQNSRSRKVWSLLEYLVTFREKEVSQNDLIELLWADDNDVTDPSNTLKTLLHRVRAQLNMLGDEAMGKSVSYRRGAYRWAPEVPCMIDVDEFDEICKRVNVECDEEQRMALLTQAIGLYKGDFLPRSALEDWVTPINTFYHNQYVKIVHEALELLMDRGRFNQALSICQKAVNIDPYEELFHLCMIKCLLATGSQRAALIHYNHVIELFFDEFGISPSEELTALYREVVKTEHNLEMDLNIIKQELQEVDSDRRAVYCEYEFFKEIYRLCARGSSRTGQVVHVALITVASESGEELSHKQVNSSMEKLKEVLETSLRRNDVYARYSVSQYLVMLQSTSYENGLVVLKRVVSAYRRKYPKSAVTLPYKILPMDPILE